MKTSKQLSGAEKSALHYTIMTAQEFIDWVQRVNNLPNSTQAVKRAAQMMRVTEDAIWKWLNTKKPRPTPEYMQLLMELLHEKYKEKRGHRRVISEEQREEMRSMLGKKPDKEIAAQFGISRFTVQAERYKLGIKKSYSRIQYDDEFIATLGKIPDFECAKRFGYSNSSVARIRKKHGIAPYKNPLKLHKPYKPYKPRDPNKPRKKKEYPEELINMLGKFPDDEIAKKFGYSRAGIALIRKNKGIPSFSDTRFTEEKREEMLSMLEKFPDREISKKTGYSVYIIKKFREQNKIEPFNKSILKRLTPKQRKKVLSMLGKVHDSVIAEKFNVTNETIRRIRKKTNVPALRKEKSWQETLEENKSLTPLLGTMTDRELADKTGTTRQVIGKIRRKLKIPPFDTRGARPEIYRQ